MRALAVFTPERETYSTNLNFRSEKLFKFDIQTFSTILQLFNYVILRAVCSANYH